MILQSCSLHSAALLSSRNHQLFRSLPTLWHGRKAVCEIETASPCCRSAEHRPDLSMIRSQSYLCLADNGIPQLHLQWNLLGAVLSRFGFYSPSLRADRRDRLVVKSQLRLTVQRCF